MTRLVALLGNPASHSWSPAMHNAAFRAQNVEAVYLAAEVAPDALPDAVAGLRALGALGANVTIPFKEEVRTLVDRCTPRAERIGAVNTLFVENEEGSAIWVGDNTDSAGFWAPLTPYADRLRRQEVVVLGAGGAARAVVYALLRHVTPTACTLVARRPEQAERLATDLADLDAQGALTVATWDTAGPAVRRAALVVNATPLGMSPDTERTPWSQASDFHEDQMAYDLVYTPEETRFLREAAARGATPVGGIEMLIGQAAVAYERWTGNEMPLEVVRSAISEKRSV